MDAGAWASVKSIPCFANLSRFGVLRVLPIGLEPLMGLILRYALVSPMPISSAIKKTILGLIIESAKSIEIQKLKPAFRKMIFKYFIPKNAKRKLLYFLSFQRGGIKNFQIHLSLLKTRLRVIPEI